MNINILSTIVGILFISNLSYALPIQNGKLHFGQLPVGFSSAYDFEGIVALSNCSGALIRLENSRDEDKALILTNGHCAEMGMPQPGKIYSHLPSKKLFRIFNSQEKMRDYLTATELVYATMTKSDMAIYKLKETYKDIQIHWGVKPYTLSSQHPTVGTAIEVISGYWNRGYSCQIEAFIPKLKEENWVAEDSIRYSRPGCQVIGGTSGSPIIMAGTKTVIGVNNTGNESGYLCSRNNPCEIDANGKSVAYKGYSYGQQTYQVYSCLNQDNEIDLSVTGCELFKN